MSTSHVFLHPLIIEHGAIDENGHANNVEYVRWMQDAATRHSGAVGCTTACKLAGTTWVARTHHIEYLRPAFEGDQLIVRTWVENLRRASSLRKYEFLRSSAGAEVLIARGETEWVHIEAGSGRPKSIPLEFREMFGLSD